MDDPALTTTRAYFRSPTVAGDTLVFVSEDTLWTTNINGGEARRLTQLRSEPSNPVLSADGTQVAFTGREDVHPEVYVVPVAGGEVRRLTYLGAQSRVCTWGPDGRIYFASDAGVHAPGAPFITFIQAVGLDGVTDRLPYGKAWEVALGGNGDVVVARNSFWGAEWGNWKRYRGGTIGHLLIKRADLNSFDELVELDGNTSAPMWVGDRVYFISDHEGIGNIYSCTTTGDELKRHTDHATYYVRNAQTDGVRIAYQHAADIYVLDPETGLTECIDITLGDESSRIELLGTQQLDLAPFVHDVVPDATGASIAIECRGRIFVDRQDGTSPTPVGDVEGVHYRLPRWLGHDGAKLLVASAHRDRDRLELLDVGTADITPVDHGDIGRPVEVVPSPRADEVAIVNHRLELLLVNVQNGSVRVIDRADSEDQFSGSGMGAISGLTWSHDGRWIAYSCPVGRSARSIKLCDSITATTYLATRREFVDFSPTFSIDGQYLYFLSKRAFEPVFDNVFINFGFAKAVRPFVISLRADAPPPFGLDEADRSGQPSGGPGANKPETHIDSPETLADRVVAVPAGAGRYVRLATVDDRLLLLGWPAEPGVGQSSEQATLFGRRPSGSLTMVDPRSGASTPFVDDVADFRLSGDRSTLVTRSTSGFGIARVHQATEDAEGVKPVDLDRMELTVSRGLEFRQMFEEAHRLQGQLNWAEDLCGVDWDLVRDRYLPLLDRVATQTEFIDLLRDMQGELGTSHATVNPGPSTAGGTAGRAVGHLGVNLDYDATKDRYHISHIVVGDSWDPGANSPLAWPAYNIQPGQTLLEIDGRRLGNGTVPGSLLVGKAGKRVELTIGDAQGENVRRIRVVTLATEQRARYREWVRGNRELTHTQTEDRVGYIHVPDLVLAGFSEFHRQWITESERDALIIDFRYALGGGIGSLMLEKLLRRPYGIARQRWAKDIAYPFEGFAGPATLLINECTVSNGDVSSHGFRTLGIGPLVGHRTWGGVIGVNPRARLVDGTVAHQPEQAFYGSGVGLSIENHGVEPDYAVDITPEHYARGEDPQLCKAIEVSNKLLEEFALPSPDLSTTPDLTLPSALPERPR